MKDSLPSCPAAPVHGHVILLSFVGMSVFGLLYRGLLGWMSSNDLPWGLIRAHFIMTVIGVMGICLNGTLGYEVLALFVQPHFYYIAGEGQTVRNLVWNRWSVPVVICCWVLDLSVHPHEVCNLQYS